MLSPFAISGRKMPRSHVERREQPIFVLASNEMRITTQQDNMPVQPPRPGGGSSLMGPIAIEATAGNR